MGSEEDDPTPTEDPRKLGESDQNAEEGHESTARRQGGRDGDEGTPDAPDTSHEREGDAGQATGNPDAAG
jgi:hypothetical protein